MQMEEPAQKRQNYNERCIYIVYLGGRCIAPQNEEAKVFE